MDRRCTYAASLSWGGDEPTAELEVEVSFSVDWGSPESGRFGPPENYDPGSPPVVEAITVEKVNGLPLADYLKLGWGDYVPGETVRQIVDKLEADHEEAMIETALSEEEAHADEWLDRERGDA